ncbi:MAG: agmatinase [Spirochaetae bacterium HGW-Spirochaetae-1]|jgi:agmatinase|nr:MAG: agmatinase [Spirochaetae bacterium HGW-Spirochaetae-1]
MKILEYINSKKSHQGFLQSELGFQKAEKSLFHVIPAPLERTVSYGGGTAAGPAAILRASQQLELYDGFSVPGEKGIYTTPQISCHGKVRVVLDRIKNAVSASLSMGSIPVLLGGEHTVTLGGVEALKEHAGSVGVVQFDAHADLRESYEGDPFSHACVMKRVLDLGVPFYQIGVRSLSPGEVVLRKEKGISHCDAAELTASGNGAIVLPPDLPEKLYLTFDIDALTPAIMPSTGTPEPGGLEWYQTMDILARIISDRRVMAFDVVELAPHRGLHAPDFTAARLIYNIMGMIARRDY